MAQGGKRQGAGRKSGFGEKTVAIRIPESSRAAVQELITNGVSPSKVSRVNELETLISKWELLITSERAKQPRWVNAAKLLSELKALK